MAKWEDLNMHERHAFIKEAVKNGIRDIRTIRDKYNEYADGGHLSREEENNNLFESDKVLDRANKVYTNYDEASDFDMNPLWYSIRNFAYQNNIPHSGLSNCTLTATQWIDPSNPIKSAKTIVSNPKAHGYSPISIEDIVPGDLMISKNPKTGSFHTMLVESINKDGTPNLRYSTGGPNNDSLRTNISQAEYHRRDSSQGGNHTEDMFFRYNYPNPSHRMVVEPYPLRVLAADCPIYVIFKHSRIGLFHPYVVAYITLRGFQQLTALSNM